MSDGQFGFRHNRSTEQAIHNVVNRLYLSMDRVEYYMGVFVGLVLRKLHHYELYILESSRTSVVSQSSGRVEYYMGVFVGLVLRKLHHYELYILVI